MTTTTEMTKERKIEVLTDAIKLLENGNWEKYVFFGEDKDGEVVALTDPKSPAANSFCVMGAVFKAAGLDAEPSVTLDYDAEDDEGTKYFHSDPSYWNEHVADSFTEPVTEKLNECSLARTVYEALPEDFRQQQAERHARYNRGDSDKADKFEYTSACWTYNDSVAEDKEDVINLLKRAIENLQAA